MPRSGGAPVPYPPVLEGGGEGTGFAWFSLPGTCPPGPPHLSLLFSASWTHPLPSVSPGPCPSPARPPPHRLLPLSLRLFAHPFQHVESSQEGGGTTKAAIKRGAAPYCLPAGRFWHPWVSVQKAPGPRTSALVLSFLFGAADWRTPRLPLVQLGDQGTLVRDHRRRGSGQGRQWGQGQGWGRSEGSPSPFQTLTGSSLAATPAPPSSQGHTFPTKGRGQQSQFLRGP